MQKKLSFAVDKVNLLEESDSQLAILEVWVCHDKDNLNHIPIDTLAMKDAAPTLLNKFLVADFNGLDFEDHTRTEMIIGFFPKENNIHFVEQDGKTYLVANSVLSKVYAEWAYDVLTNEGNSCSVSMEITVLETEEREDGLEWVTKFIFNGVTCLGRNVQEACVGANAKIIKFSVEKAESYYKSYQSNQYIDSGSFLRKSKEGVSQMKDKTVVEFQKGGETMEEEKKDEMCLNSETNEEFTSDANTEPTANAELNDEKAEENKELTDEGEHNTEEAKVMSEEDGSDHKPEEDIDWMAKAQEFEEKLNACTDQLNACMAENEELKKFKKQIEDDKMQYEVESTLKDVSDVMPKEEVEACRTMAKDFSLQNIDAWKNAVKAKAFSFSKGKVEHTPYIAMQLPYGDKPKDENGSLWSKY